MYNKLFLGVYEELYRDASKQQRKKAKKKWKMIHDYHKRHHNDDLMAHAAQMLAIIEYVDLTS